MNFDLVIKNGIIVNNDNIQKKDIGIIADKIVNISNDLMYKENTVVIDASDKYIFPGGVDVHTHLDLSINIANNIISTKDDFLSGTIAAAHGGTTTIIDHCFQNKGETLRDALNRWHSKAQPAVIDYGFHINISDFNKRVIDDIPALIQEGYISYKIYMAYSFMLNDEEILKLLTCTKNHGGLVCVHAENYHIIKYMTNKLIFEGNISPRYHPVSRPTIAESEATYRIIKLAELTSSLLYIVHVSCNRALLEISKARKSKINIIGETCPQYLLLSDEQYELPNFQGAKYILSPPLRNRYNQECLWKGLREGNLSTVATDHCAFNFKGDKDINTNGNFTDIPNGIPGIELRLPLIFNFGVLQNKITLQQFVNITSTNPAKIFGLYPKKGTISLGSDADIVIFDPKIKKTIKQSILHENVDYTPYENMIITGYPILTISRGCIIVDEGVFIGKIGNGRFLPMNNPQYL